MRARHILVILLAALAVALGVPGVAQANTNCTGNLRAGCIYNASPNLSLRVCEGWDGDTNSCWVGSRTIYVSPERWSPYTDTDGFYVPQGYNAIKWSGRYSSTVSRTGWHKVGNATNHRIQLFREP